jgi:hypothetical protein
MRMEIIQYRRYALPIKNSTQEAVSKRNEALVADTHML